MSPFSLDLDLFVCVICFVIPLFVQSFTEDFFPAFFPMAVSVLLSPHSYKRSGRNEKVRCFYSIPQQKKKRSIKQALLETGLS